MLAPKVHPAPEDLHPALWRASQLAQATGRCVSTGHTVLSNQLVGKGWPTGALIDLLIQQAGVKEIRLLAPALRAVADRKIVMLQPPHSPQIIGLAGLGITPSTLLWIKSESGPDALWAAEQILRSGSCGALLFWAKHIRPESLRRLHLAAQAGETLFFLLRPLAAAQDACPAPLRLSLRAAAGGIEIMFVKRQGPQRDEPLFLPLPGPGTTAPRRVNNPQPARVVRTPSLTTNAPELETANLTAN